MLLSVMSLGTIDLIIPTCSSARLSHGALYCNVFVVVSMFMQKLLTSALVLALEPSVTKSSGTQMSLENSYISNSTSDSFYNGPTYM